MAKKKATAKKETKKVESIDVVKNSIQKKYGDVLRTMGDKPLVIDTISTRSRTGLCFRQRRCSSW